MRQEKKEYTDYGEYLEDAYEQQAALYALTEENISGNMKLVRRFNDGQIVADWQHDPP